ncbi:hypothetical protein L3X38_012775 [Prunus dulcis]|uniref:Retrotransposon Copia-like N-terminal domain-containing protein n=1 Tax=Prunus dulcis TaxID=3755 RepID=A0AAD4WJY3_PRUDU|nr:hypothetical protein L3X38_012775 [Prunus dulcis]
MDVISSSNTTDTTPPSSQIVTIHSDNAPFPNSVTLTETNYALWSQVMEMHIAACKKLGYLTSDTTQPSKLSQDI